MSSASGFRMVIKVGVSAGLLGFLLWKLDIHEIGHAFRSVQLGSLAFATLVIALTRLLVCTRTCLLLAAKRVRARFLPVVKLYWKCDFAGAFLPGTVGGDALRIYGLSKYCSGMRHAASAVAMDRILGVLAFLTLGLAGAFLSFQFIGIPRTMLLWIIGCGFSGMVLLGGIFWMGRRRRLTNDFPTEGLWSRLVAVKNSLLDYSHYPQSLFKGFLLSVVIQVLRVIVMYELARGLGLQIPFAYLLVCVPAAFFLTLVPISVGGWGVQEGTYVTLLAVVGAPPAAVFAMSALSSVLVIVASLPGLVFFLKEGFIVEKSLPEQAAR